MMGSKERLTFLVEGDGDVTLFEEILTRRDFVVLNWENYKIISELKELKKTGGFKKAIIEEISNFYCNNENTNSSLLGFVDMDADLTKDFMSKIILNFLDRNNKDITRKELIERKVQDSRGEVCTFGFFNQYTSQGKWDWIMQLPCLKVTEITIEECRELISVARFRSHVHALKQDNRQKSEFPYFDSLWDYTNPNPKRMENKIYIENFPKYADWKNMKLNHESTSSTLNDHCLEWTIFDFLNLGVFDYTISEIQSEKQSIARQLIDEMVKNIIRTNDDNNLELIIRNMYDLD